MKVFYKSNSLAKQSYKLPSPVDYRPDKLISMVDSCTKQTGKDNIEIDAAQLQRLFFPTPQRMIFISHLATDKDDAECIKRAIESWSQEYTCFIDSNIWGNMYKIRNHLQKKYGRLESGNFSHEATNNICQHLTMVLSMALTKAIKDSPYFLYVPHRDEETLDINTIVTHSPWVCHELLTASLLPEKPIVNENHNFSSIPTMQMHFRYSVESIHLHPTDLETFISQLRPHTDIHHIFP